MARTTGYTATSGTFTVVSSGLDIWNANDSFRFTYQPLVGNGTITARVVSLENTSGSAKAGVMIRESVAPGARNAFMTVTPESGTAFQWRGSASGQTTNTTAAGFAAPYWVRLTRVDQLAEAPLDAVERGEPFRPSTQQRHQVRRDGVSHREALLELRAIEDRLDRPIVDVIGAVALDRVRHEVVREAVVELALDRRPGHRGAVGRPFDPAHLSQVRLHHRPDKDAASCHRCHNVQCSSAVPRLAGTAARTYVSNHHPR